MRATINRGLILSSSLGCRPIFSRTPGRNGSIRMSIRGRRVLINASPPELLRFIAMELLRRVSWSEVGGGGVVESLWAEGCARSMRRTEAP
jgi:hypothetical protein